MPVPVPVRRRYASKAKAAAAGKDGLLVIAVLFKAGANTDASATELLKITGMMSKPATLYKNLATTTVSDSVACNSRPGPPHGCSCPAVHVAQ